MANDTEGVQDDPKGKLTIQQTIVACTAALIFSIAMATYALLPEAFWRPQTETERWCVENDISIIGTLNKANCAAKRFRGD